MDDSRTVISWSLQVPFLLDNSNVICSLKLCRSLHGTISLHFSNVLRTFTHSGTYIPQLVVPFPTFSSSRLLTISAFSRTSTYSSLTHHSSISFVHVVRERSCTSFSVPDTLRRRLFPHKSCSLSVHPNTQESLFRLYIPLHFRNPVYSVRFSFDRCSILRTILSRSRDFSKFPSFL